MGGPGRVGPVPPIQGARLTGDFRFFANSQGRSNAGGICPISHIPLGKTGKSWYSPDQAGRSELVKRGIVGTIRRFSKNWLAATVVAGSTLSFAAALTLGAGPAAAYGPSTGPGGGTTTTAPKAAPAHHALAFTGADVMITTAGGAAAIGLGGMAVLAARKKRAKPTERVEQ